MDVTKAPLAGGSAPGASATAEPGQGPKARDNLAPLADWADIRALDIPAALQILLAEVRAEFELQAIAMTGGTSVAATADSPPQAAHAVLQMVLQAMPDEAAGAPEWAAALTRVETALQSGLDRAIGAISMWREVPVTVIDAAQGTRTLVMAVLGDDPQNPIWLRPEWAGLAPGFERFWRRRRRARRNLFDPDYSSGNLDDGTEYRS